MNEEKEKNGKRVDGKHIYHFDYVSDSLVSTYNLVIGDKYPNTLKIFEIVKLRKRSTKAERAASGIRRFKNAYISKATSEREGSLNLI